MVKKSFVVTGLGMFLFLSIVPQVKAATANTTTTSTSAAGSLLGLVEGVNSFCQKIDSQSASSYRQLDEVLIDGQSSKAIAQVRNSDAYHQAYGQVVEKLKELSSKNALAVCKAH